MSEEKKNIHPLFLANLVLKGKIECLTGLHIGGNDPQMEIGDVNSFVIRDPRYRYPYIPGSSIKGKLRHLIEFVTGAVANPIDGNLGDVSKDTRIVRIFGLGADHKHEEKNGLKLIGPTRLQVRDAFPDEETIEMWNDLDTENDFTEVKTENAIDRLTSHANPRKLERVVAGSRFDFEIIYSVYQIFEDEDLEHVNDDLRHLLMGLRLLESSALGKSGSRGYGKIKIHLETPVWVHKDDYLNNSNAYKRSLRDVKKVLRGLRTLDRNINLVFNPA